MKSWLGCLLLLSTTWSWAKGLERTGPLAKELKCHWALYRYLDGKARPMEYIGPLNSPFMLLPARKGQEVGVYVFADAGATWIPIKLTDKNQRGEYAFFTLPGMVGKKAATHYLALEEGKLRVREWDHIDAQLIPLEWVPAEAKSMDIKKIYHAADGINWASALRSGEKNGVQVLRDEIRTRLSEATKNVEECHRDQQLCLPGDMSGFVTDLQKCDKLGGPLEQEIQETQIKMAALQVPRPGSSTSKTKASVIKASRTISKEASPVHIKAQTKTAVEQDG